MRFLCTNDDGYMAPGLAVLRRAARRLGSVDVVAPDREQSATSHSLTLHLPLRARSAPDGASVVDGTPTDCIILALSALLKERPTVCLSGVNHGSQHGKRTSSTRARSRQPWRRPCSVSRRLPFRTPGAIWRRVWGWSEPLSDLLRQVLAKPFPTDTLFNVNLPAISPAEVKGIHVTTLGRRRYSDSLLRGRDPMGKEYYWIGAAVPTLEWVFRLRLPGGGGGLCFSDAAAPRPHQLQAAGRSARMGPGAVGPHRPMVRLSDPGGRSWTRRLYDWVLGWAETPHGAWALAVLALAESSFFPIPPDPLLLALCLGAPASGLRLAGLATAASVAGGVIGYGIGAGAWALSRPVLLRLRPGGLAGELRPRPGPLRTL